MIKRFFLTSIVLSLLYSYCLAQQTILNSVLITLERNQGIFGVQKPCPYYKLAISSTGKVKLETKSYDKDNKLITGKAIRSRISQEQVKQLILEFEKINFYSLNSTSERGIAGKKDCPSIIADFPTAITSITNNGKLKKLEHYHGCKGTEALADLTSLENKIDEIVNTEQLFACYFKSEM